MLVENTMLNKFSASAKLYMLIFITAASLIVLGLYGIDDLEKMNENTRSLYADRVVCMQQLANVRFEYVSEIVPIALNVKNQVIAFREARKRVQKARETININWHNYKLTYFTPEENRLVGQTDIIKNQADKVTETLDSILSKQHTRALDKFIQSGSVNGFALIITRLSRLMELQVQVAKKIFNANQEIYQGTSKKFILLILLSLAVALSLSIYIIRNIKDMIKDRLRSGSIIKESDMKYRSLLENASDAIYLVNDKGNFTEVNESMCKMTGYSRADLLELNIEQIIDPEQLKTDPVIHGYHLPNRSLIRERRLVRKDGTIFEVEINVKKLADNKMLVIARDITDRKRMEAELREAEIKFRTLAEKSMVGIYIIQKEKLLYINPRFAEIFGYGQHELIDTPGSIIEIIVSKEDQALVRRNNEARFTGEIDNIHYEFAGQKKDGKQNQVEIFGSAVIIAGEPSIIGTMIDISDRKRAEELTSREKTLSDAIINSLPGLFYLRNAGGEFLRWNRNFEIISGYNAEEITKLNAGDMIVKEDREKTKKSIEKVFSDGYSMVEAKAITKDGNNIPFLFSAASIIYENEQCLLGTGFDISSRIQAEEDLRSSEQKYKLLFESNPSPLWMIAKDNMSVIDVNEAAASLYGYSKDELLNMSVTAFRPAEDLDQQLEGYNTELDGTTGYPVVRHLKKDGTVIFVQTIAQDIIFEGRPVRLSLTNDITERLKAEESLKKSEANLQAILKTTETAYVLFDLELKAQAFNQKAIEFVKHEYYHLPKKGDRLVDFFPLDRFPQFINFTKAVLKGNHINYEIDYPQADGAVVWYYVSLFPITNDNKEILGMMMALYDITERKNAEHDLKTAYDRIRSHINSIKDMAWKQSHLIRSPLANLKGLAAMLKEDPSDNEVLDYIQNELDRMDAIIIEMAEDASNHDL